MRQKSKAKGKRILGVVLALVFLLSLIHIYMKKMISRMVSHRSFPYVMAFLMPFIICVVICIGNGVYPFGDNCILHIDMYHQYCPFFTEFLHKLDVYKRQI